MLKSRTLLKRHASYLKWSGVSARRFAQAAEETNDEVIINLDVNLTPLQKKKPQRQPFMKNLFTGEFDKEILTYPEVQTNERQKQYYEWLAPVANCIDQNLEAAESEENVMLYKITEQLKECGVFRAALSEEDNGLGLNATEHANLIEVISKNPSLALYVLSRTTPIEVLHKYGNEEQKKRFLPQIANGELIPTFCIAEDNSSSRSAVLTATAVKSDCGKFWKINAEKIEVFNGNQANCFFVLANCTETNDPFHNPQCPSVFIVERECGGIQSSNSIQTLGQQGVDVCSVTFTDTIIPRENIIDQVGSGSQIMIDALVLGRQNIGAQAAALLKRFIGLLTKHAIEKKHFDKPLMNYQFAQEIIGKMTTSLYSIESITYLTTGLMDQYENQECGIETAIVEAYSTRECVAQIYEGLQLIGRPSYIKDSPYEKIYRDALALTLFNGSNNDLHTYIAVMGLQHAGTKTVEVVRKYRNPFMFPAYILREVFMAKKVPDLGLEEHLHPSLQMSAKLLQECVFILAECVDIMLVRHAMKITEANMELRRLAEIAMDIYVMTATLGRASRSYCIGLRHSMDDVVLAHSICWTAHKRTKINHKEIELGDTMNGDDAYKRFSKRVFEQWGYFPEHPLKKNY